MSTAASPNHNARSARPRWVRDVLSRDRIATAVLVAAIAAVLLCPRALADADPASDILLGTSVFYPYSPPVSGRLQKTLNAAAAAAARAHFPIKVALIASPIDLGAIPEFFGKPQSYAEFLDKEISFIAPRAPLLVVMPDGYGVARVAPRAAAAVASLPKPGGSHSNDLARAAIVAVQKLAAAAGHPVAPVAAGSGGSGNGARTSVITVVIVVLAAVVAAGAVIVARRWRSRVS